MKRYIKASYNKIDPVSFYRSIGDALFTVLPEEDQWVTPNFRYTELTIENPPSEEDLKFYVAEAASANLGYEVYNVSNNNDKGYDLAIVDGEAFVYVKVTVGDYFNNRIKGYVDFDYNTGNAILEDWYDDPSCKIPIEF